MPLDRINFSEQTCKPISNDLANAVAESAFKTNTTRVKTPTTNTAAVIYDMEISTLPSRIEETETGLGHYQLSLIMYYRGLD